MRYYLSIIVLLISFIVHAEDNDTIECANQVNKQDSTKVVISNDPIKNNQEKSISPIEETTSIEVVSLEILAEKQNEVNSLKHDLKEKDDEILLLKGEKDVLENSIRDLTKERDDLKGKIQAFSSMSNVVFKQCLLYPLERKYNKSFVEESMRAINELGIRTNQKYKDYCDTYWDLLENYVSYNQEVLNRLTSQYESFSLKHWNISDVAKTGCQTEITTLSYYQFYKNKDVKPWKSITYLDAVIDDWLAMLIGKQTLNENNFKSLIERVTPKDANKNK